ncbi:copper chaperone PCu(A)C [Alsobacter sp. KACC 23698]|uniref:Copper chaperone PCu(A)C n=1 Tax=Alsobacter sp. KACC 23698 TaxID=3149229 RepID=A0AAU7JIJ4_9HYPH
MITRTLLAAALLSAAVPAAPALAHDYKAGDLVINHPWARATPPGASVGGGYLSVRNAGTAPDRLLSITSDVAGRVMIHEMSNAGGVMTMRPVPAGLPIPPGEVVELKPGGYHVMFMDLKDGLKAGDSVKGVLTFEKAGAVPVEFRVQAIGAKTGEPAAGKPGDAHAGH